MPSTRTASKIRHARRMRICVKCAKPIERGERYFSFAPGLRVRVAYHIECARTGTGIVRELIDKLAPVVIALMMLVAAPGCLPRDPVESFPPPASACAEPAACGWNDAGTIAYCPVTLVFELGKENRP